MDGADGCVLPLSYSSACVLVCYVLSSSWVPVASVETVGAASWPFYRRTRRPFSETLGSVYVESNKESFSCLSILSAASNYMPFLLLLRTVELRSYEWCLSVSVFFFVPFSFIFEQLPITSDSLVATGQTLDLHAWWGRKWMPEANCFNVIFQFWH